MDSTAPQMIRVMLVEDHALVRAGIAGLVASLPGIEVVAEAGNGDEALRLAGEHQPHITLMDIALPGMNGLETTEQLLKQFPSLRVIMLSMHTGQAYVRHALRVGAAGYLLKDASITELETALRSVAEGNIYLTPAISRHVLTEEVRPRDNEAHKTLTSRQREILQLIAQGRTTHEIARLLALSPKTVEAHRFQMMERLNIHDVPGLVRHAIKAGLISLED